MKWATFRATIFFTLAATALLTTIPVSANSGQRVQLGHMAFDLPAYIAPVDVGKGRMARFECRAPDTCMVLASFIDQPGASSMSDADSTPIFVNLLIDGLRDEGIVTYSTSRVVGYRTGPRLWGDRVRFFATSVDVDMAIDVYMTYSNDGIRIITYARPASWTLTSDGNGYPVMETMLSSLVIYGGKG